MKTQNHSDNAQVNQLVPKLNRLASIDPSAIARIATAVQTELDRAGASATSLSQAQLDICAGTGVKPDDLATFQAKQQSDARIVAGIPHDQLLIMKILYGDDNAVLAARYTDLQSQISNGKVAR